MKTETARIEGMTCNHCVMSVRRRLAQIENLDVEDVAIGAAIVRYDETQVEADGIDRAVAETGFRVVAHE